jgi:RNA polymerase sigma-70 factor (ECF subfamily)
MNARNRPPRPGVLSGEMAEAPARFTLWVSGLAAAHTVALAAIARYEGLSSTDAVDAVQQALQSFLLLPQARSLVEQQTESRTLLEVLVRNAARNTRRRHYRARPHVSLEEAPALRDEGPSAEELIARAEEHVQLLGCVAFLGELQQKVVTLRVVEQLSTVAVADELGLTPRNVAVLLFRAKEELKRCLERYSATP